MTPYLFFWFVGWLFTCGLLWEDEGFAIGVPLAVVAWPVFVGAFVYRIANIKLTGGLPAKED